MKVLLTGGTGLIGRELGQKLVRRGHSVTIVSRHADAASSVAYPCEVIVADLTKEKIAPEKLTEIEGVIHLLGEGIADHRWSREQKDKLVTSRLQSSENLLSSVEGSKIKHIVSATAIGIYGNRGDEVLTEDSESGTGFLADLCRNWEKPFRAQRRSRWVGVRIGVVVDPFGGALGKLIPLFQKRLGAAVGSGKQWMSWIDIRDLVNLFCFCLEKNEIAGVVNGVAPHPVRNDEFSAKLAQALGVGLLPNVPAPVLKLTYGEMSEVIFASQRVGTRAETFGFKFRFPELDDSFQKISEIYGSKDQIFFAEQYFDRPLDEVFAFFGDAYNLERITPPLLNFKIQKISTEKIQAQTLIDYRLKIHQVPVHWRTLIQSWNPPHEFTDTQAKGPYKRWIHHHTFEKLGRGTLARDLVRYRVPLGALGKMFGGSFVANDVKKIFSYRRDVIAKLLGSPVSGTHPTSA